MKKLIFKRLVALVLSCFTLQAFAIGEGFYVGVMLGPASNSGASGNKTLLAQAADSPTCTNMGPTEINPNIPISLCFTTVKPRSQQFGTRIYAGNMFNPYAGIELGFTYYSSIHYNTITGQPAAIDQPSLRLRTLDLSLKGALPFYVFTVYGRAGVAPTYFTTSRSLNPGYSLSLPYAPLQTPVAVELGNSGNKFKWSGMAGFGFAYDINQNWQVDVSANGLFVGGNVGTLYLYALGISYHMVNKYCGQFLCDD